MPQTPAKPGNSTYLVDTRFLLGEVQSELAERYRVVAVDSFWQIDRTTRGPIEAFSMRESEPSPLTWYFVSGTEPVRTIVPDPFLTWELRSHFGQPAEPPEQAPESEEQRRIQHNIAVAKGDRTRAAELSAQLEATLSPLHVRYDDGTELVGARYDDGGARPQLTLY